MKSAFSAKCADNELILVDKIVMNDYKTKDFIKMLNALNADKKALVVLPEVDQKIIKSASNIPGVKTAYVGELNVYDILKYDKLIVDLGALSKIEEVYA